MEPDAGILLQELPHQRGLVSREIVEDDVNLLIGRAQGYDFLEEDDKVAAGETILRLCSELRIEHAHRKHEAYIAPDIVALAQRTTQAVVGSKGREVSQGEGGEIAGQPDRGRQAMRRSAEKVLYRMVRQSRTQRGAGFTFCDGASQPLCGPPTVALMM